MDPETVKTLKKIEKHLKTFIELKNYEVQHLKALVNFKSMDKAEKKAESLNEGGNHSLMNELIKEYIAIAYKNYRKAGHKEGS